MARPERFVALADELIRNLSADDAEQARRRLRRGRRALFKALKVVASLALSAIVIPIVMITAGLLLGPRGIEGLIAAPLAVLTAWALILYIAYGSRVTRRTIARAGLDELPGRTERWLEHERATLPSTAQPRIDAIAARLEVLAPQLRGVDPQLLEALELRRLIAEELPDLVHGYQKVPPELRRAPLHGGPSPERRFVDALGTIEEQIGKLHERLAQGDLHSLATHQRYLELKYKDNGELD
jgi:hypothetical protein